VPEEQPPWFIVIGQDRQGPMSADDVKYLLGRKRIDGGTLIWQEGMETWSRLREIEAFHPKPKAEEEAEPEAETEPQSAPEPPPEQVEEASPSRLTGPLAQRIAAILAILGFIGGGLYIFESAPPRARRPSQSAQRVQTKSDRMARVRAGDPSATRDLLREGPKAVPGLIQALQEKGTGIGLPPGKIKGLLIAIGPSGASFIADALEGLEGIDLSRVTKIILIEVLGEFGGLQSVPSLIIALGDPDPAIQQEAKEAIARVDPAFGPALARYLDQPARPLSKQQRKNLAEALGQQASHEALPQLRQAAQNEFNPEVRQALAKAVEAIQARAIAAPPPPQPQRPETQSTPSTSVQTQTATSRESSASQQQPPQINISVSASATATATVESDEEKAEELAKEAAEHLENGDRDKALRAYEQAYALDRRRVWLLIIFDLQGIDPDSAAVATTDSESESNKRNELEPIEAPPPPITLTEIHQALAAPEPTLEKFSGGSGAWEGNLDSITPFAYDGVRELFIARGSPAGQDFIISLAPRERSLRNIEAGITRRWGGMLRGFRIINDNGTSRMLPVLAVQQIE
jgi:tetratricopeptide (TPR) repeat protein